MTDTIPWTREGESCLQLGDTNAGNCTVCSKPLVEGLFRWDDWESNPAFPGDDGIFPALRHADGSPNHNEIGLMADKHTERGD